jgi:hypothetical protein
MEVPRQIAANRVTQFFPAILLSFCIAVVFQGCCLRQRFRQPDWPTGVLGWINDPKVDDTGIKLLGVLVLRKGESTSNGKIGVRAIDIIEGDPCAHPWPSNLRKAILQFFDAKDNRMICQVTLSEGSTGFLECPEELGITGYGVQAINTKDHWVLFDLRE